MKGRAKTSRIKRPVTDSDESEDEEDDVTPKKADAKKGGRKAASDAEESDSAVKNKTKAGEQAFNVDVHVHVDDLQRFNHAELVHGKLCRTMADCLSVTF